MSSIVIGGGANGLAAALALAKRGEKVTLVESREALGGLCAPREFHPGFRAPGIHPFARPFTAPALAALGATVALRPAPDVHLIAGIASLRLSRDPDAAKAALEPLGGGIAAGYAARRRWVRRVAPALIPLLASGFPTVSPEAPLGPLLRAGFAARKLSRPDLLEVLRVAPQPVDDWVAETTNHPLLRAALAADGLYGAWVGPRSPSSALGLLLSEALGERICAPATLVAALEAAARAAGVTIRTGTSVAKIVVVDGTAEGVLLADGSKIEGRRIVSCVAPSLTFGRLIARRDLPDTLARDARTIRTRGIEAKVHLALSAPPPWTIGGSPEHLRLASRALDWEQSFDAAKYGTVPGEGLALDVVVPTVADPALAPSGGAVVSVWVHGVAHDATWDEAAKEALYRAVMARLEGAAPGITALVVGRELLGPQDLAAQYGAPGGHVLHGELALDQVLWTRPLPGLSAGRTPLRGLFLGSTGVHPGIPGSGASGLIAAATALSA